MTYIEPDSPGGEPEIMPRKRPARTWTRPEPRTKCRNRTPAAAVKATPAPTAEARRRGASLCDSFAIV